MLKTVSSVSNAIGALNYKGTWNAATNSPSLTSSVGTKGDYYVVSVEGSTSLDGISNWGVGDWAAFNGSVWQRVEGGANLNGVNLKATGSISIGNAQALAGSATVNSTAYIVVMYSLSGTATLTLPDPASNVGRILKVVSQSAQAVISASNNVARIDNGGLTNSILPATAGKWVEMYSDGSYWNIIATNV